MTRRWKLTIEYDGAGFVGWQRQGAGVSVQGCLEEAVFAFSGERVTAHAAGRTDAGVHAAGQVAHIDLEKPSDEKTVRDAINFHLRPHAAAVVAAVPVAADFHARFSALRRVYHYRILAGRRGDAVLDAGAAWNVRQDLDVDAMNRAAALLLGTHDFTSFRAGECQAKSPVRSLDVLSFSEDGSGRGAGRHLVLRAEARSFLHHQIRNIAGTLKLVGAGKWAPDNVGAALAARNRAAAGPTAPPHGLCFMRADYPA